VVVHDPQPFLNTSRHFLAGMNFIYDAAGGYVGFQWTGGAGGQDVDLSFVVLTLSAPSPFRHGRAKSRPSTRQQEALT